MTPREADSNPVAGRRRIEELSFALRPGLILGLAVAAVVGVVGIVQWDQQLILTGFIAAFAIIALNAVVVAARYWHRRNTNPGALYVDAEEVVRMRGPKARR